MKRLLFRTSYLASRALGRLSRAFIGLADRFAPGDWQMTAVASSSAYDMVTAPDESYYAEQYWRFVAPWLAESPSESSCLDLGCAQGRMSLRLAAHFPSGRVIGVDLSAQAIQTARAYAGERGLRNATFEESTIETILKRLPPASQDVVVMTEVTFFYPDWAVIFPELVKLVKPGGLLVMSFRSQYFYALYAARAKLWRAVTDILGARRGRILGSPTEYSWQTSAEVTQLFVSHGIRMLSLQGVGVCSGIPGDPHDVIARPSQLDQTAQQTLMELETALSSSNPDAGRYMLAVGRKALAAT